MVSVLVVTVGVSLVVDLLGSRSYVVILQPRLIVPRCYETPSGHFDIGSQQHGLQRHSAFAHAYGVLQRASYIRLDYSTNHVTLLLGIEFIEPLKLSSSTADTPPGFIPWLDRHLEQHDPVVRNGSHYTVTVAAARLQSDLAANELHDKSRVTNAAASSQSPLRALTPSLSSSFKCSDDRCVHFVYGFTNEADQANHVHSHATTTRFSKRDSGFSMGTATSSSPSTQRLPPAQPVLPDPLNHQGLHGYRRPSVGSSLTPLYTPSRDRGESSVTRSFPSTRPHTRGGSLESEVDPLLPPLKRNRVGHSRLQSIGELQLLRDNDPCLRCKLSHKAVCLVVVLLRSPYS